MKKTIEAIYEWNRIAGNEGKFNRHLETSMLIEELSELIIAMKDGDRKEMVDAFCDIIFVLGGTMYKQGFNSEDLNKAMKEVIDSNFSKFTLDQDMNYICKKDDTGKILKPETFRKPNLDFIK